MRSGIGQRRQCKVTGQSLRVFTRPSNYYLVRDERRFTNCSVICVPVARQLGFEMVLNLASYGAMIGESVHSGHFMMSSLTDESSDTDSGCTRHVGSIRTADIPVSRDFIRNSMKRHSHSRAPMLGHSVADVIDGSLVTLLKCMTLDYRFVVC